MAQSIHFAATVAEVIRHNQDVCTYKLTSDKRLPRFLPGQFVHLALDPYDPSTFWPTSRVFSVANSVADRRTMQVTVSRQGSFTSRMLDEVKVGSTVWGKGPYGDFSIDTTHNGRRVVLIAGGTGITPFASYLDATLSQGSLAVSEMVLYYGARTSELLVYRTLADQCAGKVPNFKVRYYTQDRQPGDDASIKSGILDVDAIVSENPNPADSVFYISGPKPMIDAFQRRLIDVHSIPPAQVLVDAWE